MPDIFGSPEHLLYHKRNLEQKLRRVTSGGPKKALVENAMKKYENYIASLDRKKVAALDFVDAVASLEGYYAFAKKLEKLDALFNWRSDYASSIIPEFFCRVIDAVLESKSISYFLVTKNAVVDLTISAAKDGGWQVRHKNQDFCIGLRKDKLIVDGSEKEFVVPMVAAEFKTNIDINKLNGLDFSAERLKRSFPEARYLLFTETIDFSLSNNYTSLEIDEVYVLRKKLRSAARRRRPPLCADVFALGVSHIIELLEARSKSEHHVYDRLPSGRLINF